MLILHSADLSDITLPDDDFESFSYPLNSLNAKCTFTCTRDRINVREVHEYLHPQGPSFHG